MIINGILNNIQYNIQNKGPTLSKCISRYRFRKYAENFATLQVQVSKNLNGDDNKTLSSKRRSTKLSSHFADIKYSVPEHL